MTSPLFHSSPLRNSAWYSINKLVNSDGVVCGGGRGVLGTTGMTEYVTREVNKNRNVLDIDPLAKWTKDACGAGASLGGINRCLDGN